MKEVKCIYGDTLYVETSLTEALNDGWTILDIQTSLYEATSGLRRDTTVYLIKEASE